MRDVDERVRSMAELGRACGSETAQLEALLDIWSDDRLSLDQKMSATFQGLHHQRGTIGASPEPLTTTTSARHPERAGRAIAGR